MVEVVKMFFSHFFVCCINFGSKLPRLRPGPNLTPRASTIVILSLEDPARQVLAGHAGGQLVKDDALHGNIGSPF
jgi:hypothetical protein